ncbi:hypothetical protein E4U55_006205 [Claviceps digitariae]|nr:hypothetical protein E4U55_006205 [Claviceps digitariae]
MNSIQSKATQSLATFQHGCIRTTRVATGTIRLHARGNATSTKDKSLILHTATSDVAKKLENACAWTFMTSRRKRKVLTRVIEPRRVNIVSEGLCDDILGYIGPSLDRHRGCDLVDMNPGAGVWSRKLHDYLQPRKHVMMDLDADFYKPYLSELLAKKNVELIPKSGIVWKDLLEMIDKHLLEQHEAPPGATPARNDTLLLTANLSTYPKRPFLGFESVTTMVLYQFMSSIRTSTLFQRYGLVRMLLWVNDDDKRRLLPRSLNRRKKSVFEAELACDWIHEVAGLDAEVQDRNTLRDEWINVESASQTLQRMKAAGLDMPRGRETRAYLKLQSEPELVGQKLAGVQAPVLTRPFKQELEEMKQLETLESVEDKAKFSQLKRRERCGMEDALTYLELLQERERVLELASTGPQSEEFQKADMAWNERISNMKKNPRNEFRNIRDNYHIFRQSRPALLWDRRAFEPLSAKPEEFFPNVPTALLDIQPKSMHPLLRQLGPSSSRSGDMSEVMLRCWFHHTVLPVQKSMEAIWAGFGDLIDQCPSLLDVNKGGNPMTGHGAMTVRTMNEEQWVEILQAWMDWPFRPTYTEMLGRLVDEIDDDPDDDDTKPSAMGFCF